jgi:ribosomal subunit interface protein
MKLERVDSEITVGSHDVDLGSFLPTRVKDAVLRTASKYFGRLNKASVHFKREGKDYHCSITMQMGGLKPLSTTASDRSINQAFKKTMRRMEHQLQRSKEALREDKGVRYDKDLNAAGDMRLDRMASPHTSRRGHGHMNGAKDLPLVAVDDDLDMRLEPLHPTARMAAE